MELRAAVGGKVGEEEKEAVEKGEGGKGQPLAAEEMEGQAAEQQQLAGTVVKAGVAPPPAEKELAERAGREATEQEEEKAEEAALKEQTVAKAVKAAESGEGREKAGFQRGCLNEGKAIAHSLQKDTDTKDHSWPSSSSSSLHRHRDFHFLYFSSYLLPPSGGVWLL